MKIHGVDLRKKIQGDKDDLEWVRENFDRVSQKHPVARMSLVEIGEENSFLKNNDGIFEAIHEGKGKHGGDLLTVGKRIDHVDNARVKELRQKIEDGLKAIGEYDDDDDGDDGTGYKNPFLPDISEIKENGGKDE